jgi:hypothetical protein
MGYDITIGEAVMDPPDIESDGDEEGTWINVCAEGYRRDDAPEFPNDEMTGKGSSRHPSYTAWAEWCDAVGLRELFFGPSKDARYCGLMGEHPGCSMLTKRHHAVIAAALDKYRTEHPTAVPGFARYVHKPSGSVLVDEHYDANLARLIWLEWWVRWALANCKVPAIYNR